MIVSILLASLFIASIILAWLFRQRLITYVPRKETVTTVMLFAAVALLLVIALVPDIFLLISTMKLLPATFRIVLALAAAVAVCVGCFKQNPEPAKPTVIHWKGQDGGYEDTTTVPPDKAATQ